MDSLIYEKIFASEKLHFYYKSNREFISLLVRKFSGDSGSKSLRILDVGCGTGLTTKYLGQFGSVEGIDVNPLAVSYARNRRVKASVGSVEKLSYPNNVFDLVVCFDVIYHKGVRSDEKALSEIYRVLKPGGICILRVPAKISSQSSYDRLVHTRHRYIKSELMKKLRKSGYNILKLSYVDAYLLPLILVSDLVEKKASAKINSHIFLVPGLINFLLTTISLIEKRLIGFMNLPFGAGLISVVSKPGQGSDKQKLVSILKRYLGNKPAFLSIIRGKEALLFNSFAPYPKPILDYGCGDGFFMETSFRGSGQKVDVGLETDIRRALVARLRKFYGKVVVYPGKKIPFPDNSFSTVISNSVLEHVSDIDKSIKEVSRILKVSGRFYVSVTTSQYEKNLFGTIFLGNLYRVWMRKMAYHVNMLKRSEIESKFGSCGFKVVDRIGYLNRENTRFLDIMQYLSIPGRIPFLSKFFNSLNIRVFMNSILRRIETERDDGTFCSYFYVLSKI